MVITKQHQSQQRQRRPLGGFETFMCKAHRIGLGLIYMVADLNTLKDEQGTHFYVEYALSRCVKRHANLRAHIVEEEGGGKDICLEVLPFEELPAAFCKVPFVKLDGESKTVLGFTQELLCDNLVAAGGPDSPLWQLVFVEEAKKKQHLVVLAHHSIMDGESVLLFLKEVVTNMNAAAVAAAAPTAAAAVATTAAGARSARNKLNQEHAAAPAWAASISISPTPVPTTATATATEPEPLAFLASSQDELFKTVLPPTAGEGTFGCSGLAFFWKRLTWILKRPQVPPSQATTTDTSSTFPTNHILSSSSIQGPTLTHLLLRCKQEETTLTGALAAATMLEITRVMTIPKKEEERHVCIASSSSSSSSCPSVALKMETMVNLRRALTAVDPKYKSCLHLFAAPIDMVIDVKPPQNDEDKYMWEKARSFKKELSQAMTQGQWKRQITGFYSFRRFNDAIYKVLERLAKKQGRVKAAAISNLGVLDGLFAQTPTNMETELGGPFRLARLQWGITEHGIGHYVFVAASTQEGVLNLTLTMPSPMVSEARAREMLKGIVGRLMAV